MINDFKIDHRRSKSGTRPTNISLEWGLYDEAKELGVNISKESSRGVEEAVAKARAERWLEENREAIEESNAYFEANGYPLAKYRMF